MPRRRHGLGEDAKTVASLESWLRMKKEGIANARRKKAEH
jgi:hypothetical protein